MYNGAVKTIQYKRQILGLDGKTLKMEDQSKDVYVRPGYSSKNNLTYAKEGH